MRSRPLAIIVALASAVAVAVPLVGAPPASATSIDLHRGTLVDRSTIAESATVFEGINTYRVQQGLPPLRFMPQLRDIAQDWSDELGETDTFAHRPNFFASYPKGAQSGGEIIAMRRDGNAAGLVTQWINSAPHRALMVGNYSVMGTGVSLATGYRGTSSSTAMLGVTNLARYPSTGGPASYASVDGWLQASGRTLHDVAAQLDSVTVNADHSITVRGWAYDLSDHGASVTVSLWVEGRPAVRVAANRAWQPLNDEGVRGAHGFVHTFAAGPAESLRVCGLAANAVGPGAHQALACIARETGPALTRVPARDTMQASVDFSRASNAPSQVREVYLAPSHVFYESLMAAPAAARAEGALLLVDPAGPSSALLAELRRLAPTTITAVGGSDALSEATLRSIRAALPAAAVARVPGADLAEIGANLARRAFPGAAGAYLSAAGNLSDTISASSAAAERGVPLLVAPRAEALAPSISTYVAEARPARVTIVGGAPALAAAHERQVEAAAAGVDAVQVRGADRFITNAAALRTAWTSSADSVYLASAMMFGHAGLGSAIAVGDGPVALTAVACVPPSPHAFITGTVDPAEVVAMGSTWTVSDRAASLGRCSS